MNRPVRMALLAVLATGLAALAGAAEGQPPLLDRELFFGNPEITAAQLSPDGQYIAFLKPWKDTRNIWVKKTDEPFEAARPITAETKRPIPGFFWSRTASTSSSCRTRTATRTSTSTRSIPAAATPRARRCRPRATSPTPRACAPSSTRVPKKRSGHDLRRPERPRRGLARPLQGEDLDRRADARAQEHREDHRLGLRPRGPAPAGHALAENGDTEILRVDADGFKKVYSCNVFETCGTAALPQGRQARLHADQQGRARISSRLVLFDPETGKEELVEADPAEPGGLRQRDLLGRHRRARRHDLRGRADPDVFPGQGLRGRLRAACRASCPARRSPSAPRHERRPHLR